ncbi:unnamed protein product [Fraxinus pennsylvanica]|uniref:Uncharacterized protein n=1 Tax=Fraxinus pennsylvanica TaxID=56036 RepID=A0AAD2E1F9_9LAMI|nr:unnamed protein product [Fraxinus pennsylvanica]
MLAASSMGDEHEMSSLRERRKKSPISLSCFFQRNHSFDGSSSSPRSPTSTPKKSPSAWIRSKAHDFPEIKHKCRNLISRIGRQRCHSSADFSYDPLSYSLNFDHDDHAYEFCGSHLSEITTKNDVSI